MTLESDVARLARTRPFNLLPREAVQLVAFSCEKRRLRVGDALFLAGEIGDAGYFVHSGAILLTEGSAEPKSVRRIGAGALIGESALYAPIERRVEARAAEDALVLRVQRETFRRVLAEFPEAAKKVRAALAQRTRRLVDGLEATRIRSFDGAAAPDPRAAP
jgi:CRP-like cAMP-binding protein